MDTLRETLAHFPAITLGEMDKVALQSRVDTKYLVSLGDLPGVLADLADEYRVLEVGGQRGVRYRTLYFDTARLQFFHDHHNGRPRRCKVRMREYVGSGTCFLEVKRRTGRGSTDKRRMPIPALAETFTPEQAAFVALHAAPDGPLFPTLRNEFFRYTLVHQERVERITLDLSIAFSLGDRKAELPGICIAELKEGRTGHGSPFAARMHALPAPPTRFSKYCVGSTLLRPGIKANLFKPLLLRARKLGRAA